MASTFVNPFLPTADPRLQRLRFTAFARQTERMLRRPAGSLTRIGGGRVPEFKSEEALRLVEQTRKNLRSARDERDKAARERDAALRAARRGRVSDFLPTPVGLGIDQGLRFLTGDPNVVPDVLPPKGPDTGGDTGGGSPPPLVEEKPKGVGESILAGLDKVQNIALIAGGAYLLVTALGLFKKK